MTSSKVSEADEVGDLELMRLRLPALYTSDDEGRLLRVNEPDGAEAPRFFLGRTSEGHELRFRRDVSADVVEGLAELCQDELAADPLPQMPSNVGEYLDVLARASPIGSQWAGPAYRFPRILPEVPGAVRVTGQNAALLAEDFVEWVEDPPVSQPFMALLVEGGVASVCCSVRITPEVHEAGVETRPSLRGRGYASQAVVAWASAVRSEGACPVYSTSWENTSSLAVARRLGLIRFGVDFHVT